MYLNGDGSLLVLVSSENLRFLGWDDGISWDQLSHHPTNSFNTKGKWCYIQEKDICNQNINKICQLMIFTNIRAP